MFTPAVLSSDIYGLWRSPRRSLGDKGGVSGDEDSKNVTGNRSLYAPPLLAYSADYPGASLYQLEYTIAAQEGTAGSSLPPQTHRKLERLQRIRNTGMSTIVPIGMTKTMRQMEAERAEKDTGGEDEPINHMVENVPSEHSGRRANVVGDGDGTDDGDGGDGGGDEYDDRSANSNIGWRESHNGHSRSHSGSNSGSSYLSASLTGSHANRVPRNNSNLRSVDLSSVDLDAGVQNMDDEESSDGTFATEEEEDEPMAANLGEINEDEGFMADEVEYQEDHSFASEMGVSEGGE